MTTKQFTEPIFTVKLEKGLATRSRLPIEQVIAVLDQVRQMINDAGKQILKERGDDANPNFGLEIIGDEKGKAFTKGSLEASIAITNNVEVGVLAAARVMETVFALGSRKPVQNMPDADAASARIVNRLDRIAFIGEKSKAQARMSLRYPARIYRFPGTTIRKTAVFGQAAIRNIEKLREPVFEEHGITIYGKLFELSDRTQVEREHAKFWGELRRDNGERWRIQFADEDADTAVPLFRKQVRITGDAYYFQTRSPKLVAATIVQDEERDYLAAFDEIVGSNKRQYGADTGTLLRQRYGDN